MHLLHRNHAQVVHVLHAFHRCVSPCDGGGGEWRLKPENNPRQSRWGVNGYPAKRLAEPGTKVGPVARYQDFTLQCYRSQQNWTIFFWQPIGDWL